MPYKNKEDYNAYHRKYERTVNYPRNRVKILSYKKSHSEKKYHDFKGHIRLIYGAIKKFASHPKHLIEICTFRQFRDFTLHDIKYQELHAEWVLQDYDDAFAPVVSRKEYHKGYLIGNLYWGKKQQFGISRKQITTAGNLIDVVREIERQAAMTAQAPKSVEDEERSQRIKKELREMKKRQEERFRSIGRK